MKGICLRVSPFYFTPQSAVAASSFSPALRFAARPMASPAPQGNPLRLLTQPALATFNTHVASLQVC